MSLTNPAPSASPPDISTLSKISLSATLTIAIGYSACAATITEDTWLRHTLVDNGESCAYAFGLLAIFELLRWSRGLETERNARIVAYCFTAVHVVGIAFAALALMAVPAQMKGAQEAKESPTYKAQIAYNNCLQDLADELDKASEVTKAKQAALIQCFNKYDETQVPGWGYTSKTPSQACKTPKAALQGAEKDLTTVKHKSCDHLKPKN